MCVCVCACALIADTVCPRLSAGVNGSVDCIRRLHHIHTALIDFFKIREYGKHQIYEMNANQSLVYIFTKKGAKTDKEFCLGFSLEWECNIITGMVLNYHMEKLNVDTFVFLMYCNEDGIKIITDVVLAGDEAKELVSSPNFSPAFDFYEMVQQKTEMLSMKTSAVFHSKPVVSTVKRRDSVLDTSSPSLFAVQPLTVGRRAKAIVTFEERIRVILTPKTRGVDMKNLFFSSADFRRFQRDKNDELEREMQEKNVSKIAAVLALYQDSSEEVSGNTTENGFCLVDNESVLNTVPQGRQLYHADSLRMRGTLDLLTSPYITSSNDDSNNTDNDDDSISISSTSSSSVSLSAPRPRRLSMDDEVDRDSVEKQQLDKEEQWQQFHVSKLREYSIKKDPNKKKALFPPRGFVLKRYLPPPKVIHPTVVYISLLRCQHLTPSIFWPIVSTDSYVQMIVDGERQRSEIVRRKRNPKYNSSEVYTFALEYENTIHNYIDFEVFDESRTGGEDALLGTARVAFAALHFQPSPRPPQKVTLPLCTTRESLETLGSGKGYFPAEDELKRVGLPYSPPVPLEKQKATSCISMLIAVVDGNLCQNFSTLAAQDAEMEARVGRGVSWIEESGDLGRRTLSSEGVLKELAW